MVKCECFCVCCDTQTFMLPDSAAVQELICPWCGRHLLPRQLQPFGEGEWLACNDPTVLVSCVGRGAAERMQRLFACACCRRYWHMFPDRRSRAAVEAAERFADGLATGRELARACDGAAAVAGATGTLTDWTWLAVEAADPGPSAVRVVHRFRLGLGGASNPLRAWMVSLVRDVFGNPFRTPHLDPAWLTWEGGTVRKLAEGIYQDQAFDRLPILADALEEAGCADEQVLAHCRGGGPHVRGCWVLDLLLGRE
jgi:hypothetical protein